MFEAHFGLRENPFVSGHQPRFVFPSPEHQEALAHLRFGIENREPFVLITGEVGTGKTTALYDVLSEWQDRVQVALITNSALTRTELLEEICLRFGFALPPGSSKPQALAQLERHLLALHGHGHRAVLLFDEAQNLDRDLLEEIRLLSNLEYQGNKLMQVFLVGQPELEDRLGRPELRQLRQRISVHYRLSPLSAEDTERYIHHRIAIAGGYAPNIFPADACHEVYALSHGIPREINQICAQALLGAFVEDARAVTPAYVRAAAHEIEFESVLPGAAPATAAAAPEPLSAPAPVPAPAAPAPSVAAPSAPPVAPPPPAPAPVAAPRVERRAQAPELPAPAPPIVTRAAPPPPAPPRAPAPAPVVATPPPVAAPPPSVVATPPAPTPPPRTVAPAAPPTPRPEAPALAAAATTPGAPRDLTGALPPRLRRRFEAEGDDERDPSSAVLKWMLAFAAIAAVAIGALLVERFMRQRPAPTPQPTARATADSTARDAPDSTAASAAHDSAASAPAATHAAPPVPVAPSPAALKPPTAAAHPVTTKPTARAHVATESARAPARHAASSSIFGIAVATYLDQERAQTEQARLAAALRLPAHVRSVTQDSVSRFEIVVGAYASQDSAERAASALIGRGLVDEARVVSERRAGPPR